MDALAVVRRCGGVARTRQLRAAGLSSSSIAAAVRAGRIERVRIGHYIDPALPDVLKQAHRVGGPPTCVTAAMLHGAKSLHTHPPHVAIGLHDSRFRDHLDMTQRRWPAERTNAVLHWDAAMQPRPLIIPLAESLVQASSCLEPEDAVCLIDSALHGHPELVDHAQLMRMASGSARSIVARADGSSESVTETVFRLRGLDERWPLRAQVPLPGSRRGDFLIAERLLVEVDGAEFHAGIEAFIADRERDALMAAHGYYVLRFTYDQTVRRWHEVASVISLVMRRGDHLWPRGRRPI